MTSPKSLHLVLGAINYLENEMRVNREELLVTCDLVRQLEDVVSTKEEKNKQRYEDRIAFQHDVLEILGREALGPSIGSHYDKKLEKC